MAPSPQQQDQNPQILSEVTKALERYERLLAEMTEIKITLARMEERNHILTHSLKKVDDIEAEMSQLTRRINYAAGAVAVIVSIVSFLGQSIWKALHQ